MDGIGYLIAAVALIVLAAGSVLARKVAP